MATKEQIANYREWQRRETLASARVESGQYGYTDPQPENDGVSLASTHDEMAQIENEYGLTLAIIESTD